MYRHPVCFAQRLLRKLEGHRLLQLTPLRGGRCRMAVGGEKVLQGGYATVSIQVLTLYPPGIDNTWWVWKVGVVPRAGLEPATKTQLT